MCTEKCKPKSEFSVWLKVKAWFMGARSQAYVQYPDGARSSSMPLYVAIDYAKIFDGKVIQVTKDKQ